MIDFDQTTIANMTALLRSRRCVPAGLYVSATREITPMPDNILSPKRIAVQAFTDAAAAVAGLAEIYERNVSFLRAASLCLSTRHQHRSECTSSRPAAARS